MAPLPLDGWEMLGIPASSRPQPHRFLFFEEPRLSKSRLLLLKQRADWDFLLPTKDSTDCRTNDSQPQSQLELDDFSGIPPAISTDTSLRTSELALHIGRMAAIATSPYRIAWPAHRYRPEG